MGHVQQKKLFFDPTTERSFPQLPTKPNVAEINDYLDNSPLSKIIVGKANEGNMRILKRFAFKALNDPSHSCRSCNFGIYSKPGQGKTFLVKQWADTIGIPFLKCQSDALESTWMLFCLLIDLFDKFGTQLIPDSNGNYCLPPCIVFFDEAHALNNDLRTGGLLNAMEYNDGILKTKMPGKNNKQFEIDCKNVCWVAATTDPGLLYKTSQAFYDRLANHIEWAPATQEEIAEILSIHLPSIPFEACEIVAFYEKVPRKAINFANQMELEVIMNHSTWQDAADLVARDNGIDQYGMHNVILNILVNLSKRSLSDNHIINAAGCRKEQFHAQYAPILLSDYKGEGPLARPTTKGWTITKNGCKELDIRGIQHNGYIISTS